MSVNCVVFLGPTLSHDEARSRLDATFLPPAGQGDVLRAAKEQPFAIAIIDGYFERVPAVWHKEILWALSRGIHVYGAASMGALRAAELARFGMKGVGEIFESFQAGALEDDDEVAVAHGDASTRYRAISEAMVNVRATLRRAEEAGVIGPETSRRFERLAKTTFYPDRSYPRLFALALKEGIPASTVQDLSSFVAAHRVDQKRSDALALLDAVAACCRESAPPQRATFSLAHTAAWDAVVDWAAAQPPLLGGQAGVPAELVAAEVRLLGPSGRWLLATGLNRAVAAASAADLRWLRDRYKHAVDRHVVDELRLTDDYTRLAARAGRKQDALAAAGLDDPRLEDAGVDSAALFAWYFEQRLGSTVPVDLDGFLNEVGLADRGALQREALRELLYVGRFESAAS